MGQRAPEGVPGGGGGVGKTNTQNNKKHPAGAPEAKGVGAAAQPPRGSGGRVRAGPPERGVRGSGAGPGAG